MKQHSHGADVLETIKKYGVEKLMDFSSNVNIFTPAKIEQLIQEIKAEDLAKYPDIHYTQLRDKLSKKYKLASEQIIVGNGSTELIFLLARNANRIGIINPTFGEYQRAAEIFGKEVVHFFYDEQFQLHIDSIDLQNVDLLFVCNPNNPSGNTNSLVELLNKAKESNTLVMVDETFMDFVENGEHSMLPYLKVFPNLVVLKAVTKFYSMTGVRLGYAFGSEKIISDLWSTKEPWSINVFAERLVDAIFDEEFENKSRTFFAEEIPWMKSKLEKIDGIAVYPSQSNYFLLKLPEKMSATQLKENMVIQHGILIRDCSNYKGLSPNHIRVNIKTREENIILINALEKEIDRWQKK